MTAENTQNNKNPNPGYADGGSVPRFYSTNSLRYRLIGIRYENGDVSLKQYYEPKYKRTSGHALNLLPPHNAKIKQNV